MRTPILAVLVLVSVTSIRAGEMKKTDLHRERFVADSTTDFVLKTTHQREAGTKTHVFALEGEAKGVHTVLCFVNGRLWRQARVKLPGAFKLSTRGLAPGTYRVTLQAVTSSGRVGSSKHELVVKAEKG